MSDYWDEDRCHTFAHNHIYGDRIYNLYPDDPQATRPEPDDSRLDELLNICLEEEDQLNRAQEDTSNKWGGYYDELNDLIKKPAPCKEYTDIITYFLNNELYIDLLDILRYPTADNLKYNHDDQMNDIFKSPSGEELNDNDWERIATYLN